MLRIGFAGVALGVALLTVLTSTTVSMWVAVPIWSVAGAGMGLAMPTISVLLLELSPAASQGANSAALQISDMAGSIVGIAAAGALVTAFSLDHLQPALIIADLLLAGIAALGVLASSRTRS
jgi:MFS family permease